jgi:hypothetical protein
MTAEKELERSIAEMPCKFCSGVTAYWDCQVQSL